jgi:hypothetical protein
MYIYQIENLLNHKKYIGSTNNPIRRKKEHFYSAKHDTSPSYDYPLQKAIRKYGEENFLFSVIEECTIENVAERERVYILKLNTLTNTGHGYNQTLETDCAFRDENIIKNSIIQNGTKCALVDENENILRTFISFHEAAREMYNGSDASPVRQVCDGLCRSINGFIFRRLDEEGKVIVPIFKTNKRRKAIYGIKINDINDIVVYDSISEAARMEKISRQSISKCINGSSRYSQVNNRVWREQGYELTDYEWNNIVKRGDDLKNE